MKSRLKLPWPQMEMVPETAWQRVVVMAIERGKFQNLLFDDFDRLDHAALRAVTRIVVGLPVEEARVQHALAVPEAEIGLRGLVEELADIALGPGRWVHA